MSSNSSIRGGFCNNNTDDDDDDDDDDDVDDNIGVVVAVVEGRVGVVLFCKAAATD